MWCILKIRSSILICHRFSFCRLPMKVLTLHLLLFLFWLSDCIFGASHFFSLINFYPLIILILNLLTLVLRSILIWSFHTFLFFESKMDTVFYSFFFFDSKMMLFSFPHNVSSISIKLDFVLVFKSQLDISWGFSIFTFWSTCYHNIAMMFCHALIVTHCHILPWCFLHCFNKSSSIFFKAALNHYPCPDFIYYQWFFISFLLVIIFSLYYVFFLAVIS